MNARVPDWFDPHDERTARAAWSRLAEPDDPVLGRLLAALGPAHLLLALWERPDELAAAVAGSRSRPAPRAVQDGGADGDPAAPPGATARDRLAAERRVSGWRLRVTDLDPRRDLATVRRFGGRLLVPADPEWPEGLAALGDRAPSALWVRGPLDLGAVTGRAVAVVGCRACSGYGELVAGDLAAGCCERGLTVVSGAAYGIDACAHRGAISVGGATVAVLACGVDRPYPRGNEALVERIAAEGAVVSEIAPGSSPTRGRFVARNRLIAALSAATVVVEAGWRSGASITAREADALGRPVGAVPGPVTSPASAGCHRLLRDGAVCVTGADEVAELVEPLGAEPAGRPGRPARSRAPAADHDGLDEVELRVLDALPLRRAVDVDRLCVTAGLDRSSLLAAAARLELRGLARRSGPLWSRAPAGGRQAGA